MKIFLPCPRASFARLAAAPLLLALVFLGVLPLRAAPPSLNQLGGSELPGVFRAERPYTLSMVFTDADGDRPKRARFIDRSDAAGNLTVDGRVGPGDPRSGVVIEWPVRGFAQGGHRAYFEVTGSDGKTARYPAEPSEFYSFAAESLIPKLVILGVGLLVGLLFVPFLFYILFRAMNRKGDPSRAARVGLLLGILACTALFIYLFASFYGPLVYVLGGVVALALLAVVLTRR